MRTLNAISIASIISICSLLTAPFVQQVIQVDYVTLAPNSTLTPDRVLYHNKVAGYSEIYVDAPDLLRRSMEQGISFNRDLNDPLSRNFLQLIPSCPTGNCSFDIHDSLAVCSECADISSLLDVHQNYTPPNQLIFYNYSSTDEYNNTITKFANWTTEYPSNRINWTLPSGCWLGSYINLDPDSDWKTLTSYNTFADCDLLKVKKVDFPIANITIIQPSVDDQALASLSNAKAQECSVHWCVNRYQSQIIHGYLFEEVLDSSRSGRHITLPNLYHKMDDVFYELTAPGNSLSSSPDLESSQWLNGTTNRFVVGRELASSINFDAGLTLGGSWMDYRLNSRNYNLQVDFSQDSSKSTPQSNQPNVEAIFEAVALSMTTALRSHNQPDGVDWGLEYTPGRVTTAAAVLKIRWIWLTLPASLQIGTLILLLHSRFSRSRKTIPVWKSSALAAVFFGGQGVQNLEEHKVTNLVEMNEIASRVRTSGLLIEKGGC